MRRLNKDKHMNRIIVTPAGRRRYLEILLLNLLKCRHEFDEWHLWKNTTNQDDIDYIDYLGANISFIKVKEPSIQYNGNYSIHQFFAQACDPNSVYLRLDDDICYIRPGSINTMYVGRRADFKPFLLYGNTVNNSVISYIHQRIGACSSPLINTYECMSPIGWNNNEFVEHIHNSFLFNLQNHNLDVYIFPDWLLLNYERVSINVICWNGSTFNDFRGEVGMDEEQWLSVDKPREMQMPNKINGSSLFVHFAFHTQRPYLETTELLNRYHTIANL